MSQILSTTRHVLSQYEKLVKTDSWKKVEALFQEKKSIFLCTHGGNISISRHLASNMSRHLQWSKSISTPDSSTVSVWHGDFNYNSWLVSWLTSKTQSIDTKDILVIGISSSGSSQDVDNAIKWSADRGISSVYISAQPVEENIAASVVNIQTNARHYFSSEVVLSMLFNRLLESCDVDIQKIKTLKLSEKEEIRDNSYEDEKVNIGIDFAGVIHKCSKGYYDGTIYDDPIPGSYDALLTISEKYDIIINTCKAKPDRPLVGGKTGTELVREWLEKHDMLKFVKDITSEKPRAVKYIDDKAIEFFDWERCLKRLEEKIN